MTTHVDEEMTSQSMEDDGSVTQPTDESVVVATGSETAGVDADGEESADTATDAAAPRHGRRASVLAFWVLPIVAMLLAAAVGYVKFEDSSVRDAALWRTQSAQAAKEGAVAMLSYRPDTVEQQLGEAQNRLTGDFKNSYAALTHDVVIPGAKERQISATASVPAVASVSATANDAVALVFVNQTTVIGTDAPSDSASTVKVTLRKSGENWLISGFDPV